MKQLFAGVVLVVSLTACGVSTQQEVEMGQQYSAQINQQLPIIADVAINRYVNQVGNSIARLTSRTDLTQANAWKFYVVDSKEVNAFAVPGGFIYVNRGLIERTTKMDQFAGVLGHEIGHVVRRHSIQQMQQQQGANVGISLACVLTSVCDSQAGQSAIQLGGTALFAKFSRTDEAEADAEGVANTVRAGINPNGIPEMFQILIDERSTNPSAVDGWFSTHPMEEDRIASSRALIAKYDPAIIRSLATDNREYQTFKARVRSLPPSPTPKK